MRRLVAVSLLLVALSIAISVTAIPQAKPTPKTPALGETKVNPKDGLTYVWIPPGTFQMGCSPGDSGCANDEKPAHAVTITKGFWMGQTEVTQAAYQRVTKENPSHFPGDRLPVEDVIWAEADNYCTAVGMNLPTEAQWEYAARAGSTASRYGEPDATAWHSSNSGYHTQEVAQKQPNAWKLHDMLGNVKEWTGDWYGENYYRQSPRQDPRGPAKGKWAVLRGGSWDIGAKYLRVSSRDVAEPEYRGDGEISGEVGFRCAGQ